MFRGFLGSKFTLVAAMGFRNSVATILICLGMSTVVPVSTSYGIGWHGFRKAPLGNWTQVTTTGAPSARGGVAMVWTGTEFIIWGGKETGGGYTNGSGGRYNPSTNSWTATSTTGVFAGRDQMTPIWTGSKMILYGGRDSSTALSGGRIYDPSGDSWTTMATSGDPGTCAGYGAVWTGSVMVLFGGWNSGGASMNAGYKYNPTTDTWTAISSTGVPAARHYFTAVWTGTEVIVWGGNSNGTIINTGGRYNPTTDTWATMSTTNAPAARETFFAGWTGSKFIVWGGKSGSTYYSDGAQYDPGTDTWTALPASPLSARTSGRTGMPLSHSKFMVWGGNDASTTYSDGAVFDTATNLWTPVALTAGPVARRNAPGIWNGTYYFFWGGVDHTQTTYYNTGGLFKP